jgi:hypothetical protein
MKPIFVVLLFSTLSFGQLAPSRPGAALQPAPTAKSSHRMFWRLLAADLAVNSVDIATSIYDQKRYNTTEMNPLFGGPHPSTGRFVGQYAAQMLAFDYFAWRLEKRHPRIARAMLAYDLGGDLVCVRNNFHAMRPPK